MHGGNRGYPRQGGAGPGQAGAGGQDEVRAWFTSVDRDRSGQICPLELQQALVNGNMSKFSEDTCKMMISMFDANRSGTIDIQEFQQLFRCGKNISGRCKKYFVFSFVNQWRAIFVTFDRDRSGSIESAEFSQALAQLGFNLSPTLVNVSS